MISEALSWPKSREYFYWHLRRRLAEDRLVRKYSLKAEEPGMSREDVIGTIIDLLEGSSIDPENDKAVLSWLSLEDSTISSALDIKYRRALTAKIQSMMSSMPQEDVVSILGDLCKTGSS